jgi:predicted nuclease of restriction endonuclease-like RecB superfamily
LLPRDLLSLTSHDRETTPRYLTARDEDWVAAVVHEVRAWVGRTIGERALALRTRSPELAAEHGIASRLIDGLLHVLTRTYSSEVACGRDPVEVRAITFDEAALHTTFDREAALARAAARLHLDPRQVEAGLFADRERARRIVAPLAPVSSVEARDAFNLSLVEGLLARSARVVIELDAAGDEVIRFARRAGLLCTWTGDDARLRLDVSGPLSILRHTAKYGRALARFFPVLLGRPHLHLHAHCLVRDDEKVVVHITDADPVFRHTAPPAESTGIDATLVRAIERLGTGWEVVPDGLPEDRVLRPDLVLRRGACVVHVEIIRFHTTEHLRRRIESLPREGPPTLVCLDESLACDRAAVPHDVHDVLRFRRRLDAATLLRAADALVDAVHDAPTCTLEGKFFDGTTGDEPTAAPR